MHTIRLCMGSSCFAHGSARLLDVVRDAEAARGDCSAMTVTGGLCFGECGDGPVAEIDGRLYRHLTPSSLALLLHDLFAAEEGHA